MSLINVRWCVLLGSLAILFGCSDAAAPDDPAALKNPALWVDSTRVWASPAIPVCWESPADQYPTEKGWVRDIVARTWEAASLIRFGGWGPCTLESKGIRIVIEDVSDAPHAGIGQEMGVNHMSLNFTFMKWKSFADGIADCAVGKQRKFCISAVAVHEFGHALGFAHEQDRPDKPSDCNEPTGTLGDTPIGPWDRNSVMNYCNPNWNGDGVLSRTDIAGVQAVYSASGSAQASFAVCCDHELVGPVSCSSDAQCVYLHKESCNARGGPSRIRLNGDIIWQAIGPDGLAQCGMTDYACRSLCCNGKMSEIRSYDRQTCVSDARAACNLLGGTTWVRFNDQEVPFNGNVQCAQGPICKVRCCDGYLASLYSAKDVMSCSGQAGGTCQERGGVIAARFDGTYAISPKPRSCSRCSTPACSKTGEDLCWAKCKALDDYQQVPDVKTDCTGNAGIYCAGNGGLDKATWASCKPELL